ncbi:hypothetical protein GQ53DRAFT_638513 [Thozetella sp. PMI_491]|nr:hypothetical protein GQ53DRAFT_638513 [Thozetella sp. PMI_491]
MDDEFGADDDLLAAMAAAAATGPSRPNPPSRVTQPTPQKIQQPTPQRLDRAPPSAAAAPKVTQPTPQALPSRSSGSSILVSPRQKGNPVLAALRSMPWEYSDIPADYVLGLTTCALFLSLKYHRLHPEYIYTRIRNLQGKYNLRILLTMVDIPNHEDSLRELSKTSLINNVTVILCWSAAEAARYLELYKSYEHANFSAIQGHQATGYAEKLVEFVTVPRSVNKTDAVGLVSMFGSLKNAINADPEQIGIISGWGEKKVKKWTNVVEEPFRVKKAGKRRAGGQSSGDEGSRGRAGVLDEAVPIGSTPKDPVRPRPGQSGVTQDDEEAMLASAIEQSKKTAGEEAARRGGASQRERLPPRTEEKLADGVAAALAKLRENG